jgi:hypothetical protein
MPGEATAFTPKFKQVHCYYFSIYFHLNFWEKVHPAPEKAHRRWGIGMALKSHGVRRLYIIVVRNTRQATRSTQVK